MALDKVMIETIFMCQEYYKLPSYVGRKHFDYTIICNSYVCAALDTLLYSDE